MHKETSDQRKDDEHENEYTDYPFGYGSSNHSKSNPEVIDVGGSMDSKGKIDVITRGERSLEGDENNYSETHTNATGRIIDPTRRLSPSFSLESSSNDAFKVETVKFESEAYRIASKDEQDDVSSCGSTKSEVDNSSPPNASTHVPSTVSPPIQVMDPSRGYDPKRIPSSVFVRNSSPVEWSTASNESLFSIHLGNNSFSQEHAYMFNELYKSRELTKSGEFCMFSPNPLVIPEEKEIGKQSVELEESQTNKLSEEPFKSGERSSEDQNKVENPHPVRNFSLSNFSGNSRWSGNSTHSFAFPILTEMEKNSSVKTDVPQRQSDEEAFVPQKRDKFEVVPRSTNKCYNRFRCFSWSSCWTQCKCCHFHPRRRCCCFSSCCC